MEKFKARGSKLGRFNAPGGRGGGVARGGVGGGRGRGGFASAPAAWQLPPPRQLHQLRQHPYQPCQQQQRRWHAYQQQRQRCQTIRRACWRTRLRRGSAKLLSSDPLNLRWVAAESQRRELAGLSPMPGDSAVGSPEPPPPPPPPPVQASASSAPAAAVEPPPTTTYQQLARRGGSVGFKRPSAGGGRSFFQPIYGNYRAYYGKRLRAGDLNIGQMQDDRLELLQPDWYLEREVLDIGCNDGVLSLKIAETLGVKSLTGVDIDGHLVQRAQRNLRLRVREAEAEARVRRSLAMEGFEVQPQPDRSGFPYNVYFQTGNYVLDSEEQLARVEENKYDIIQAFSITKWIHLNWGDRGLKLFFRRAFRELKPDGKLILEPQPFLSYKKKLLCPEHKRNYAGIQLRPEQFRAYLEQQVGFAHILSISEQQQYHGFQRPVLMCTKPTGRTPAPLPPPLTSMPAEAEVPPPPPPPPPQSAIGDVDVNSIAVVMEADGGGGV